LIEDFFVASEEVIWTIDIVTKSPLNIKSGEKPEKGEGAPLFKYSINGEDRPVIPGSSFKGILRTEVERILNSSKDYWACDPFTNSCGQKMRKIKDPSNPSKRIDLSGLSNSKIKEYLKIRRSEEEVGLCVACVIFGSTIMRANSRISDFIPEGNVQIKTKTGTAISRLNGSVKSGALFPTNYVLSGQKFSGKIAYRGDKKLLGFLAGALLALNMKLLTIGAYSSKGFGEVEITIKREERISGFDNVTTHDVSDTEAHLKKYIEELYK